MDKPTVAFRLALRCIAAVMAEGAKTHSDDWSDHPAGFHVARAARHLRLHHEANTAEDHLAHATCRLLMALELREQAAEVSEPPDILMSPIAQRMVEAMRAALCNKPQ
jgi:hypothetical protein